MPPSQELVDAIYRDKVLRARRTPLAEKLFDGPRLFDYACRITRAGIRAQNPGADEALIEELLKRRLHLREKLERRHEQ
jgi:hypothetical protein